MIRHQRKVWLLALVIFFCVHNAALPQPCAANLSPSDDNLGYRRRATPERCEGFYNRPMAGESLELLSFLIGSPLILNLIITWLSLHPMLLPWAHRK